MLLIQQEFRGLEGWLLKNANPKLTNLAKLITGDLKDAEKRWECETEIRIVKTYAKTGQTKVDYVESLIGKLTLRGLPTWGHVIYFFPSPTQKNQTNLTR